MDRKPLYLAWFVAEINGRSGVTPLVLLIKSPVAEIQIPDVKQESFIVTKWVRLDCRYETGTRYLRGL